MHSLVIVADTAGAQPREIYYRKSKVIAGVNIITNNFDIKIQERCFFVGSICFVQLKFS